MLFDIASGDQHLSNTSNSTMERKITSSENCIYPEQEHSTYFLSQAFEPSPLTIFELDHIQTDVDQSEFRRSGSYGRMPKTGEFSSGLAFQEGEFRGRAEDINESSSFSRSIQIRPASNLAPQSFPEQQEVLENVHIDNEKEVNVTERNRQRVHDAQKRYSELMPQINEISAKTINRLLVDVLGDCSHNIPLDDFYNMLYSEETPSVSICSPEDQPEPKLDKKKCSDSKLEELTLCHLILKTIKQENGDFSLNFEVVRRTFLGIIVLFDSLKPAHETTLSEACILRGSVYKAYYIICKKLAQRYSHNSNDSLDEQKLLLTQSQLGKILRIVFPTVEVCRKGKRGDSKFNYRGVTWNTFVVDEEIMSLAQFSLPDLEIMFKNSHHKALSNSEEHRKRKRDDIEETSALTSDTWICISEPTLMSQKPLHSFVSLTSIYPTFNCFPRTLHNVPGQSPRQAKWALEAINKSIAALKKDDIILKSLPCNLNQEGFCAESVETLFDEIIMKLHGLPDASRADDLCLHLYLVVLILMFPMILSSNKEVSTRDKTHLRESLINFVRSVESVPMIATRSQKRMAFTGILKRIIDFTALSMLLHSTSAATSIIKAMIGDTRLKSECQFEATNNEPTIEEICTKSAFMACSAFNWKSFNKKSTSSTDFVEIIERLSKVYIDFAFKGSENISKIPELMNDEDLQSDSFDLMHQIFTNMVAEFHETFLGDGLVKKLPMMLINNFLFSIMNEMQNISFRYSAKRKTELSTQLFRAWWIHVNMVQGYMYAISELCALSQHLS